MIAYEPKQWKILFLLQWRGSVFPKSLAWAIPACIISILVSFHFPQHDMGKQGSQVWSGYNFVLGFLIVFRTQSAYSRFWEGATLLQQVRGEWFNAVSSLFAFCSTDAKKSHEVEAFQHVLIRLMSLLYTGALQQICNIAPSQFEVLEHSGIARENIEYLQDKEERCEIILQWIQRLVVDNMSSGGIPIPPPVISRVFQELSRGIVSTNNARKISDVHFPFPYVQMITTMLWMHWLITPVMCGVMLPSRYWAGILCFAVVFAVHSINYIAEEIEMPFGEDLNDLPVIDMMGSMNRSLMTLMNPLVQQAPKFDMSTAHLMGLAKLASENQPMDGASYCPWDKLFDNHNGHSKKSTYGIEATVGRGRPSVVAGNRGGLQRGRTSFMSVLPDGRREQQTITRSATPDLSAHPSQSGDEQETTMLVEVTVDGAAKSAPDSSRSDVSRAEDSTIDDVFGAKSRKATPETGLTATLALAATEAPEDFSEAQQQAEEGSFAKTEATTLPGVPSAGRAPDCQPTRSSTTELPPIETELGPAGNRLSRSFESQTGSQQPHPAVPATSTTIASTMERETQEMLLSSSHTSGYCAAPTAAVAAAAVGAAPQVATAPPVTKLSFADLIARSQSTLRHNGPESQEQGQQSFASSSSTTTPAIAEGGMRRPTASEKLTPINPPSAAPPSKHQPHLPPDPALNAFANAISGDGDGAAGIAASRPQGFEHPPVQGFAARPEVSHPATSQPQAGTNSFGSPRSTVEHGSPAEMVWPPRPAIPTRLARLGAHQGRVKPSSE